MPTVTFDISPSFDYVVNPRRRAIADAVGNGSVRARAINERGQPRYRLVFDGLPSQVLPLIAMKFDDTLGGVDTMNYTPLGAGSPIEVRFAEGTLETIQTSAASGTVTLELEQVL